MVTVIVIMVPTMHGGSTGILESHIKYCCMHFTDKRTERQRQTTHSRSFSSTTAECDLQTERENVQPLGSGMREGDEEDIRQIRASGAGDREKHVYPLAAQPGHHPVCLLGSSGFPALGFHKPKDDTLGLTGQKNKDSTPVYDMLSTSPACSSSNFLLTQHLEVLPFSPFHD